MATRKQLWHPEEVRQKIQASQLINRLMNHVEAEPPGVMDSSQVNAARTLLNKVLPDLKAMEVSGKDGGPVQVNLTQADSQVL
jgi:hypothetical protein